MSYVYWGNQLGNSLSSEALSEDLFSSHLLVFVSVHPEVILVLHDLGQDGSSQEDHVLSSRGILNSDLELGQLSLVSFGNLLEVQVLDLLLQSRGKSGIHSGSSRKDNVVVEFGSGINIGLVDAIEQLLGHSHSFNVQKMGFEENLGSLKSLSSNSDDSSVGKGVRLDKNGGLIGQSLLEFEIITNVAELLLDLSDCLKIGSSVEGVSSEQQKSDQVSSDISSSNVQTSGKMGKSESFVDGNDVSNTITRIDDNSSQQSLSVKGKDSLNGNVARLESILLKHDFNHLLSVLSGIHGSLSEHDLRLLGLDLQSLEEGVIPDVAHIVPVSDDSVIQRISDLEHGSQFGGFISNHDVLQLDVVNLFLRTEDGSSNHRREDGMRKVGSSETALDKSSSVVTDNNFV